MIYTKQLPVKTSPMYLHRKRDLVRIHNIEAICSLFVNKLLLCAKASLLSTTNLAFEIFHTCGTYIFALVIDHFSGIATEYTSGLVLFKYYVCPIYKYLKCILLSYIQRPLSSMGKTTLPNSSTFLTIPVDFIASPPFGAIKSTALPNVYARGSEVLSTCRTICGRSAILSFGR